MAARMRLLAVVTVLAACVPDAKAPAPRGLDSAIHLAGTRLRNLARPDGSFVYEYEVADRRELPGYNIVRHAGAIYALAMFEHVEPDARTRAVIANASKFMIERTVRPLATPAETSAVFSMPMRDALDDDAVLGATGLGLLALIAADELAPGSIPLQTVRALGNFVVYMQRADGSFFSTYTADKGPTDDGDSLYYPGEAILALARLAARDRDPRWHEAALRGIRYLATSRAGAHELPSDNWALIATEELLRAGDVGADDRALMLRHAAQIAAVNTSTQITDASSPLFGCFTDDGRTTPSSTHLEGLLAAAAVVPGHALDASITAGIHFLLASQLADGAMPADQRRLTVRIDYVQHALSAFIRYRASR
jgi:hypothetical protein